MKPTPEPPEGLNDRARAFWTAVQAFWIIDDAVGHELLARCCETITRLDEVRAVLADDGLTIRTRFDELRAHPLLATERDARLAIARLCRELRISEPPANERPPRLGGKR